MLAGLSHYVVCLLAAFSTQMALFEGFFQVPYKIT